ncbi:MAG: hypothetical protein H6Q15_2323 [Bacteroidetes bacterium]|nr:hypothetical protein [Bacteroidota bacterium]
MRKIIMLFFILLLLCCKRSDSRLYSRINFKPELSTIVDSFVKVIPHGNLYNEIYIDKEDPHNYSIILYSGRNSLAGKEIKDNKLFPCVFTEYKGVKFSIFSGVEKYFCSNDSISQNIYNRNYSYDEDNMRLWVVSDSFNIVTVKDYRYAYPFMSLPLGSYKAKIIKIKRDK